MHKELLISILGLESNASDEQISNAARTFQTDMISFKNDMEQENERLQNSASTAEGRVTALTAEIETLKNTNKGLTEELVNSDLERYKDRITNADEIKVELLKNRAGTVAILKNIKVTTATETPRQPLHNAKTAAQPTATVVNVPNELTPEQVNRISNRAREISRSLKTSHQQAWTMAQNEVRATETAGTK
jgi:hypothetical protein